MTLSLRKQKRANPLASLILGNCLAAAVGLIFFRPPLPQPGEWLILAVLEIVQLGFPYFLLAIAIRHVTAMEAGLIPMLEPILNPIWVLMIIGERPGPFGLARRWHRPRSSGHPSRYCRAPGSQTTRLATRTSGHPTDPSQVAHGNHQARPQGPSCHYRNESDLRDSSAPQIHLFGLLPMFRHRSKGIALAILAVLITSSCRRTPIDHYQGYFEGEFIYVAAPTAGNLQVLHVNRGDTVSEGDLLFNLDPTLEVAAKVENRQRTFRNRTPTSA
jgi:hypothetical protein